MRAAVLCLACVACTSAKPVPREPADAGPVVVELFTSQGCSSCPPADRWLATLRPGTVVAGRPVIPLAFHVDYWNDLGWADPFSSSAWSDRQAAYGRVYTPELVVAGGADAVGSQRDAIAALIAAAPPTTTLDASLTREPGAVVVHAHGAHLFAAVVTDGAVTPVARGENAGAELHDDHIVRALVPVDGDTRIPLPPAWGEVRVVVFAQESGGPITAARAL